MPNDVMTILLPRETPEAILSGIRTLSPQCAFIFFDEVAAQPERMAQVDVSFGSIAPAWWLHARRLRWLQMHGAGVDDVLIPEVLAHPVVITNAHIHAETIASHLFGMLLMFTRRLHAAYRLQWERRWLREEMPGTLAGKTMGIFGAGTIGIRTAEIAKTFGMCVLGMRRSSESLPSFDRMYAPEEKAEMLAACDVVILALPLTAETDGFIGAAELARMQPGALLFNIGRGRLIDTEAMVDALRSGQLGGAGLDVTEPEPLPADHPLWTMPNVLITPHYAGLHPDYLMHAGQIFLDNFARFLAGKPLTNVVDKTLGY